jgi:hypothetical protein
LCGLQPPVGGDELCPQSDEEQVLASRGVGAPTKAAAAPAASASHVYVNPSTGYATPAPAAGQKIQVNPSTGYASVGEPSTADIAAASSSPEPLAVAEPSPGGFDWGSAGVGAAVAGVLMLLAIGGFAATSRARIVVNDRRAA